MGGITKVVYNTRKEKKGPEKGGTNFKREEISVHTETAGEKVKRGRALEGPVCLEGPRRVDAKAKHADSTVRQEATRAFNGNDGRKETKTSKFAGSNVMTRHCWGPRRTTGR